jgi:hypothetical protein
MMKLRICLVGATHPNLLTDRVAAECEVRRPCPEHHGQTEVCSHAAAINGSFFWNTLGFSHPIAKFGDPATLTLWYFPAKTEASEAAVGYFRTQSALKLLA